MKTTNINKRADSSGRHNDRNFDLDKAPHINQDKVHENMYYTYNDEPLMSLREVEREFYDYHFEQALEKSNEKHKKSRHKERIRTMEQYYTNKNTRPEDKILQIGNINEHATKEELWACALEYKDRFEDIYGDHCRILDMALHMDEATPHVHVRRVWIAEDEFGNEIVSQNKALDQLGILPPNPQKEVGRFNNAKMTLTQTDIELFKRICFEHGLDVDMEKPTERQRHLETKEYKLQQNAKNYVELQQTLNTLANFIQENPHLVNAYEKELKEAENKGPLERNKALIEIMIKAFESIHGQIEIADFHKQLGEYIDENNILSDYDEFEEWRGENYPESDSGAEIIKEHRKIVRDDDLNLYGD